MQQQDIQFSDINTTIVVIYTKAGH